MEGDAVGVAQTPRDRLDLAGPGSQPRTDPVGLSEPGITCPFLVSVPNGTYAPPVTAVDPSPCTTSGISKFCPAKVTSAPGRSTQSG
jgi:hypothetical protein